MLGVGGLFCEWQYFDGGWPSMFYVGGGIGLVFCLIWTFIVYDSPAEHPRISAKERTYIERSRSSPVLKVNQNSCFRFITVELIPTIIVKLSIIPSWFFSILCQVYVFV